MSDTIIINVEETPTTVTINTTDVASSFSMANIDHTVIDNRGFTTHAEIDTYISSTGLQEITEINNTTDQGLNVTGSDIVVTGTNTKVVAPEFETSGGSLKLSQRITEKAFGTFEEIKDEIVGSRALSIKVPVTTSGTGTPTIPVIGDEFSLTPQPVFSDVFTGNIFSPADFVGTGDFITNTFVFRFQDAGKSVRLRVQADTGSGVFDLFGTSEDPYLRFVTVAGLNTLVLDSPIPTNTGVNYITSFQEETGGDLNIQGDNSSPPFDHFRSFLGQSFSEEPYNKLGDTLETILVADSFDDQEPSGTDNPLQVEFGAAQGTGSDPVEISVDGLITFNEEMLVFVNLLAEYGRTGAAGESEMRFRTSINGTPISPVLSATLSNQDVRIPLAATFEINATVGMTLSFQILRDSSGNDSGGFFPATTVLAGWDDSPSARLVINRFV